MVPIALTIAGSDPSGGAGIQADLKTFHQLGVYGMSALTLITVQNTLGVTRVEILDPSLLAEQLAAVISDLPPQAAKTGALGNAAIVEAIVSSILNCPLVNCPLIVDPVMISKQGAPLMDFSAREALTKLIIPRAALVTPNLHEAGALTGMVVKTPGDMREAAVRIAGLGAISVLIKGGHLEGDAMDLLFHQGKFTEYSSPRIATRHTHGTGCTYSAAITAFVARGLELPEAVRLAKRFIHEAIKTAPGLGGGQGQASGPVNHWAAPDDSRDTSL